MHDILRPLIDWETCPQRSVSAGATIIAPGEPTSVVFLLKRGRARAADGSQFTDGDILSLCESLALDAYSSAVDAASDCELLAIRMDTLEEALRRGGRLVWPLSLSIAADVTQRRLAG